MPILTYRHLRPWVWLKHWLAPRKTLSPELQRAQDLISAIDAGGMPLNPARVNDIARKLGLEVSTKAPMDQTILRIRAALAQQ
ncbi:MAG: hypothetical protein V4532_17015 [Pseudomonadota bacterium]